MADNQNKNQGLHQKSLKYSVVTKFVNFDPNQFASKVIIVDGKAALPIKGRIYKEIK